MLVTSSRLHFPSWLLAVTFRLFFACRMATSPCLNQGLQKISIEEKNASLPMRFCRVPRTKGEATNIPGKRFAKRLGNRGIRSSLRASLYGKSYILYLVDMSWGIMSRIVTRRVRNPLSLQHKEPRSRSQRLDRVIFMASHSRSPGCDRYDGSILDIPKGTATRKL